MKYITNFLTIACVAILLFSCGDEAKKEEKIVRPVKYQEVGFLGGENFRTFSGTARTDKIINLSFRNSGIITVLDMKLGQKVKKGQLLSKLDNVGSRLAYEQSITTLNSAASQMNTAKLSLNRMRTLFEKGSASLSDFEAAKNSFNNAEESHKSAKRGVDIQQEQIRYGYIYAPEDGIIASIASEVDENVQAGQAIGILNSGTDMEISLGLPENVINQVKEDMTVAVNISSLQDKSFNGRITEVSPAINQNTSTYPVRLIITDPSEDIKSGMAANVTFHFENQQATTKTLVIPAKSVGEDDKGNFVFLIDESGSTTIAKKQPITIGKLSSEGFAVTKGLAAGQKIAVAGLQTLLDGQEVKLQ